MVVEVVIFFATIALVWFFCFHEQPKASAKPDESKISPVVKAEPKLQPEQPPSLHFTRQPVPGDSDEALLQLTRGLVAQSPEQALEWVARENDAAFRERLFFAVLRAWGEKDPNAAVDWALRQDTEWRFKRMEAALTGAVMQPAVALQIGKKLLAGDVVTGNAYGTALIGALNRGNQFQTAFLLAADAPMDVRGQWLDMTFRRWGEEQPQDAMRALGSVADADLHQGAFHSVVEGWAAADPKALANYACTMAPGADRGYALGLGMVHWSEQNPTSMAEWLNTVPANQGVLDVGASLLISRTDGAERTPEVAMAWVRQISDPGLQYEAFTRVLNEWSQTDAAKAWQYCSNATWLSQDESAKALALLQSRPANNATSTPDPAQ